MCSILVRTYILHILCMFHVRTYIVRTYVLFLYVRTFFIFYVCFTYVRILYVHMFYSCTYVHSSYVSRTYVYCRYTKCVGKYVQYIEYTYIQICKNVRKILDIYVQYTYNVHTYKVRIPTIYVRT